MQKLTNVKGRINYITSHARQENLYATYLTVGSEFWSQLTKESQQEFMKSGTAGKCIEARELIIALPEDYVEYNPEWVVQSFTDYFKETYGTECVAALHHNKRKTNYHIHLIFSERELLEKPVEKIATRNMFYNEQGKRTRTKKEILDENGGVRDGCSIIKKGDVYERRLFSNKDDRFKSEQFLKEVKEKYTELINESVVKIEDKLQVFSSEGVYLATKKIGKNNPKYKEIERDNEVRKEWNQTADIALISGISKERVINVKREEIAGKVKSSIKEHDRNPALFHGIVKTAIGVLQKLIQRIQHPPKPVMPYENSVIAKMENIRMKLEQIVQAIRRDEEIILPALEQEMKEAKGLLKGKERKRIADDISITEDRISSMKVQMETVITDSGFGNVQDFISSYNQIKKQEQQYKKALHEWKIKYGNEPVDEKSILKQLKHHRSEANTGRMVKKRSKTDRSR